MHLGGILSAYSGSAGSAMAGHGLDILYTLNSNGQSVNGSTGLLAATPTAAAIVCSAASLCPSALHPSPSWYLGWIGSKICLAQSTPTNRASKGSGAKVVLAAPYPTNICVDRRQLKVCWVYLSAEAHQGCVRMCAPRTGGTPYSFGRRFQWERAGFQNLLVPLQKSSQHRRLTMQWQPLNHTAESQRAARAQEPSQQQYHGGGT